MILLGLLYAFCINANINGVSHNFIHNPYFRSPLLNRLFGVVESVACCFSQTYYDVVHMQHHKGNSDKQDEHGETTDWISIYRHGHDDEAENVWSYTFLSFFRDNPAAISRELKKRGETEVRWGNIELATFIVILIDDGGHRQRRHHVQLALHRVLPAVHVPGPLLQLPQRLLPALRRQPGRAGRLGRQQLRQGLQLDFLQQRLPRRAPFPAEVPLDDRCTSFYLQIQDLQRRAGTRVISQPHMLGFLDPDLPTKSRPLGHQPAVETAPASPAA